MHATDGIMVSATQNPQKANIGMSARSVDGPTKPTSARKGRKKELEPQAKCPHYTCSLLWDDQDNMLSSTAQYSLTAAFLVCLLKNSQIKL